MSENNFPLHRSLITTLDQSENRNQAQAVERENILMVQRENIQLADRNLDSKLKEIEELNAALTLSRAEQEDISLHYQQLRIQDLREIQSLMAELGLC